MKRKFDSHCVECGKPCMAPRGNFNASRVSLCKSPRCRRMRKTKLQKDRRRQQILAFMDEPAVRARLVLKSAEVAKKGSQAIPRRQDGTSATYRATKG